VSKTTKQEAPETPTFIPLAQGAVRASLSPAQLKRLADRGALKLYRSATNATKHGRLYLEEGELERFIESRSKFVPA
jgi:hypothetical protein